MNNEDWAKCIQHGLVVVPFKAYAKWNSTGNYSDENFVGMKFACIDGADLCAIVSHREFWLYVDSPAMFSTVRDTPEEAIEAAITQRLAR